MSVSYPTGNMHRGGGKRAVDKRGVLTCAPCVLYMGAYKHSMQQEQADTHTVPKFSRRPKVGGVW